MRISDWSSDVCSSDLRGPGIGSTPIFTSRDPEALMQTVFSIAVDALAYGMVLFVISIGLSVTMGLMRVVNLAHGAFAMIGGYIASYAAQDFGLGYAAAILLAVAGTVLIAIPLEQIG